MAKKLPAFQFYPGDWMKDPALRSVSIAARGLWIDMLCLMHESSRRGYLQHSTGKRVTAEQLARMTGCSTDDVSQMLRELEDSGVYSCTDNEVIYSRRVVRDEKKRQKCSEAGKRGGGNPQLKNPTTFKGQPKGDSKGRFKGASKGGSKLNPKASSSSSTSSSSSELRTTASTHSIDSKMPPPTPSKPAAADPPPPKTVAETIKLPPLDDPTYPAMKEALDIARGIDAAQDRNAIAFEGKKLKVPISTWETWIETLGIPSGQLATACAILDADMGHRKIGDPISYVSKILMTKSNDGSLNVWMRRAKPKNLDIKKYVRVML